MLRRWNVKNALVQMHGMEQACRLLIADLDRELVDRDSFGIERGTRSIGVAVTTTVMCALLCEYAIKTLQALLRGDGHSPGKGHDLLELYDSLREDYEKITGQHLDRDILGQIKSKQAWCPSEWQRPDVRDALKVGATNFDDWRYGYPETGELKGAIPKGVFAVARGLELICRRRYLSRLDVKK